jgi:hypothetical protein
MIESAAGAVTRVGAMAGVVIMRNRKSQPVGGSAASGDPDAAVGRLAVIDASLCDLLRDILSEVTDQDGSQMTTGRAAQALLREAKSDSPALTPDVTDWLRRVVKAAEKRNEAIHAIARDRCVNCGNATRFEHKGRPVDRSVASVGSVTDEMKALINEGAGLADAISRTLNAQAVRSAESRAATTGIIQAPRQVLIGQNLYRCAACSPDGTAKMVVRLPALVAVLPPSP